MTSTPKVTIGLPTYNRPLLLQDALKRIVEQTYENLEIIVSDNASPTDEVDKIVRNFMVNDSRIQYYRQSENFGPGHNFQFVLDKATGDFFMWASDDDWRAPEYVGELVKGLVEKPTAALAFCNFIAAYESGSEVAGYPDFLRKMTPFTHVSTLLRQFSFFLQNERSGKANPFYGLIRREHLRGFQFSEFGKKAGLYGVDMLFVFWLLGKGPLSLSERCLYRSTVGNQKDRDVGISQTGDLRFRMRRLAMSIKQSLDYSWRYLLIAEMPQRLVLIFLLPLKVLKILWALLSPILLSRLHFLRRD